MSVFNLSTEAKREFAALFIASLCFWAAPTLVINTTHGLFKSLHTLAWFSILTYGAYLVILTTALTYLYMRKAWSFGPPLILFSSVGFWIWSPVYAPFAAPSVATFTLVQRLNAILLGNISLWDLKSHDYSAIFLAVVIFFHFALGMRLLIKSKNITRPRKGADRFRSKFSIFGDSRWGSWKEIKSLVTPKDNSTGIVVGEDYDPSRNPNKFDTENPKTWLPKKRAPLIHYSPGFNSGHSLFVCGSGGGKTAAYVIPNCLTFRQGIVVSDPVGDVFKTTKATREAMGRRCVEVNLKQGIDLMSLLKPIYEHDPLGYDDLADIFILAESKESFDTHYKETTRPLVASFFRYVIEVEKHPDPLKRFLETFGSGKDTAVKKIAAIIKQTDDPKYKIPFTSFIEEGAEATQWTFNFLNKSLAWMRTPEVLEQYSVSSETNIKHIPDDMDIFITITSERLLGLYRSLFRAILTALIRVFQNDRYHRERRLFMIDEAAVTGYMSTFSGMRDRSRQYRIHLMMIYQNTRQIIEAYGQNADREWISGMACFGFSGTTDLDEARMISGMCGTYTAEVDSKGTSSTVQGTGVTPGNFGSSTNQTLQRANLIEPSDITQMPLDSQILFFKGQRPIHCGKAFYFCHKGWADDVETARKAAKRTEEDAALSINERLIRDTLEEHEAEMAYRFDFFFTGRYVKKIWRERKAMWAPYRAAELPGLENKIRNFLTLEPKYDMRALKRITAPNSRLKHMTFEEIRAAQIEQYKQLVFNEANWGIRRFLEQGLSYSLAIHCDQRFHPQRDRSLDDMKFTRTRKEFQEWIDHYRATFPGLAAKGDALEKQGKIQSEAEFYNYQELHPDDYILPRDLQGSFVPQKYRWGTKFKDRTPYIRTRLCDCPPKGKCTCGMRNHPSPHFGTIAFKTRRGLDWAQPWRYLPLSESKAPRHSERTEPYMMLPPPEKYDQRKGPAPRPFFDPSIKVDWKGNEIDPNRKILDANAGDDTPKDAIAKIDVDGINDLPLPDGGTDASTPVLVPETEPPRELS